MNSHEFFLNMYREEIDHLSVKSFTGRNSGLISDFKTVLESLIPGQKSFHLCFSGFMLFYGQIIVLISKLPSKTAKLPSKVRIAVLKSWLSCKTEHFQVKRIRPSLPFTVRHTCSMARISQ